MPNFFDKLMVRTPSYNIFPQVKQNKLSYDIGRNIPIYYNEIHAGEEIDISIGQLTRFMPMTAPVFHKVNLEVIPFFVPYRLLEDYGFAARDFFNPATPDSSRPVIPTIKPELLYDHISSIVGSIWDYLRYPTFVNWLRELMSNHSDVTITYGSGTVHTIKYQQLYTLYAKNDQIPPGANIAYGSIFNVNVQQFWAYVVSAVNRAQGLSGLGTSTTTNHTITIDQNSEEFWDLVFTTTGKKYDEFVTDYLNYLHIMIAKAFLYSGSYTNEDLSLLPWLCYVRLMTDWFINTNITDVSAIPANITAVLGYIAGGDSMFDSFDNVGMLGTDDLGYYYPFTNTNNSTFYANPTRSLWQSDYFTSAFPTAQNDAAVSIPANGTIADLRNASKLQKFRERTLFAGKRFIDQIFAHRGVKSSDARLDRCEVIGKKLSYSLQISDVLQTSQSTLDSSQGNFSGHGIFAGGDHLCHYRAEEPGLVMVIARVRPRSSYLNAVPKIIYKKDFYDFENPEFDNVGMQPVMYDEVFHGAGNVNTVFGYHRRYTDYMVDFDEYHGDMQTSLDYWHMARVGDNGHPLLNTKFVTMIESDDDFNRIFASPGTPRPVISEFTFNVAVSRPLSKFINFDF